MRGLLRTCRSGLRGACQVNPPCPCNVAPRVGVERNAVVARFSIVGAKLASQPLQTAVVVHRHAVGCCFLRCEARRPAVDVLNLKISARAECPTTSSGRVRGRFQGVVRRAALGMTRGTLEWRRSELGGAWDHAYCADRRNR
jgi:hypothetical protein